MRVLTIFYLLITFFFLTSTTNAEDWPRWRGPNANSVMIPGTASSRPPGRGAIPGKSAGLDRRAGPRGLRRQHGRRGNALLLLVVLLPSPRGGPRGHQVGRRIIATVFWPGEGGI